MAKWQLSEDLMNEKRGREEEIEIRKGERFLCVVSHKCACMFLCDFLIEKKVRIE